MFTQKRVLILLIALMTILSISLAIIMRLEAIKTVHVGPGTYTNGSNYQLVIGQANDVEIRYRGEVVLKGTLVKDTQDLLIQTGPSSYLSLTTNKDYLYAPVPVKINGIETTFIVGFKKISNTPFYQVSLGSFFLGSILI